MLFCYVLTLIFECTEQKKSEGDAVDVCASPHAFFLASPRDPEPGLPQMSASAPPPMTATVTVALGHPPWGQPTASPCTAQTLALPPAAPRQLLGVVGAPPSHGALRSLLPGVKLSNPPGLFAYSSLSEVRCRGLTAFLRGLFITFSTGFIPLQSSLRLWGTGSFK